MDTGLAVLHIAAIVTHPAAQAKRCMRMVHGDKVKPVRPAPSRDDLVSLNRCAAAYAVRRTELLISTLTCRI
jgi:hypothetical protein